MGAEKENEEARTGVDYQNEACWQIRLEEHLRELSLLTRPAHVRPEDKPKAVELIVKMMHCLVKMREAL